jgi:DNA-binding response OmpR family regulator
VPLVLLVEDHSDTRLMYAEFLSDDFQVIQAANGEEALAAMRARPPDLVITDLSLPGVDGFELMRRMRREAALATVPVICLSGYGHTHERRAREAGCDRLLHKPCLPDALLAAAIDVLRQRNQGHA